MFKRPGEYDEDSFWYAFISPDMKALDMATKARAAAEHVATQHATASSTVDLEQSAKIAQLEHRLFSLGLYARATLQVLVDKGVLTLDEFQAQMDALDVLDGKRDGR